MPSEHTLREKAVEGMFVVRLVPALEPEPGKRRLVCEWQVQGQDAAVDLARVLSAGHPSRWTDVAEVGSGRMVARFEPSAVVAAPEQDTLL